jgi:hypothetical protein
MTKLNKIIPLGAHCNITFLLQHLGLKRETSLFEWFQNDGLNYINDVLTKINWNNIDSNIITGKDYLVELGNYHIYSYHYKLNEFKDIYIRRAKRFYDIIQSHNDILFIRMDMPKFVTTLEEILEFRNQIDYIKLSGTSHMKFMIITIVDKPEDFIPICHEFVIHRYILSSDINDPRMKEDVKIQHQLRIFLEEAGYNMNDNNNTIWNDKSIS